MHLLILLVFALSQVACRPSESVVKQLISDANFCAGVADCFDVGSHCPFSCHVLVNKQRADEIAALIERFESSGGQQCFYECVALDHLECKDQKCIAVTQSP